MPKSKPSGTFGYWLWTVLFAIAYPVISVFTFLFTAILSVFSVLSSGIVWLLTKIKKS
ncbi:MAG: hypothetical protein U0Y10_09320 [Spirosomataceae bacterium]